MARQKQILESPLEQLKKTETPLAQFQQSAQFCGVGHLYENYVHSLARRLGFAATSDME
ncbi:MAG: hypothetical protein M2R45_02735 [Verrucomicrobia subdivision 3 bacterium]|nr:hypothetical protein [Limisphaerales bacterium]MCS1415075.1 hypothetical protein [Limisphaerales bacterium]